MSRILDADTVAAMLGCSTRTVEDHARAGVLPGTKFGEGWVFVDELVVDAVRRKSIAVVGYHLRVDFGPQTFYFGGVTGQASERVRTSAAWPSALPASS